MMNRYRCRTCDFATKQLGIKYCLKVNRVLDVASFNYVGCASHSSQRSERDKVLDDYCNIDLTYYVWGEMQSDDVGLCQGKTCNYCGRYNAELHQQSKQEEQG